MYTITYTITVCGTLSGWHMFQYCYNYNVYIKRLQHTHTHPILFKENLVCILQVYKQITVTCNPGTCTWRCIIIKSMLVDCKKFFRASSIKLYRALDCASLRAFIMDTMYRSYCVLFVLCYLSSRLVHTTYMYLWTVLRSQPYQPPRPPQVFHEVAYRARNKGDLLAGIDEFLDKVTVLPPGEWDPQIRLEPPSKIPSQGIRKQSNDPRKKSVISTKGEEERTPPVRWSKRYCASRLEQ